MNRAGKKLLVERLENRNLMAGNVNAFVNTDGDLIVSADDAGNTISIESAGAGTIQVRGFADAGGATSVNGNAATPETFTGVTRDVIVQLRGGNDFLRVSNLVLPRSLVVEGTTGSDNISLGRGDAASDTRYGNTPSGPLYAQGDVNVFGSIDNDVLLQSDVHVQGAGLQNLGNGNDIYTIQRPVGSGANVEYSGALTILPGAGNDQVDIIGLVVDDNMVIDDSSGVADVEINSMDVNINLSIISDILADRVAVVNTSVDEQLLVASAAGNDNLNVSAIADVMVVDAGAGRDTVSVNNTNTRVTNVQLGTGNDDLDLLSARADLLNVFGNSGDDVFLVRNTRAIDAYFYGEGGFDIYRDSRALPNNIGGLRKFTIERNERV